MSSTPPPPTISPWQRHADERSWPDLTSGLDIHDTSPGHLYLEPEVSGRFQDYRGDLFKVLAGDFAVTTRVHTSGLDTDVQTRTFALAGLMARAPRENEPLTPNRENWLFIDAGTAKGLPGNVKEAEIGDHLDEGFPDYARRFSMTEPSATSWCGRWRLS